MSNLSKAEVKQLRALMSKASMSPKPTPSGGRNKSRRKRKNTVPQGIPAALTLPPNASATTSRSRRSGNNPGSGTVTIKRSEFLGEITVPKSSSTAGGIFSVTPASINWLSKIAGNFQTVVWHVVVFKWRPAVGTSQGGTLCLGMDWSSTQTSVPDRKNVQAFSPSIEVPFWQSANLNLPRSKLMTRREYILDSKSQTDQGPGILCWALKTSPLTVDTFLGDLWIDYSVTLSGPKT